MGTQSGGDVLLAQVDDEATFTATSAMKEIAFGSVAGMVAEVFEYPFDLAKVRLQAQLLTPASSHAKHFDGPMHCLMQTWKEEGVRGMYRGLPAPMVGAMAETAALFLAYTGFQNVIRKASPPTSSTDGRNSKPPPLSIAQLGLASAGAGFLTSFVLTPIELVKCKMQVQMMNFNPIFPPPISPGRIPHRSSSSLPDAARHISSSSIASKYSKRSIHNSPSPAEAISPPAKPPGPIALTRSIIDEYGVRGLWLGHTGTLLRETGGCAAWFVCKEYVARKLVEHRIHQTPSASTDLLAWESAFSGAVAGAVGALLFYPADTVKSAIQTEDELRPRGTLLRKHKQSTFLGTFRKIQALSRYFSGTSSYANAKAKLDNKAFSDTLLLPKTSFKLRQDLKEAEAKYENLTCENLYQWQWENAKGPLFVLHDGPPYANGDLHIGHALNKVIKDIINRFHVTQGRKVHYVPGWDCHGLPIENKAMKDMKRNPLETPPSIIREGARATALREIDSQREQFRPLAVMADWYSNERTYRTLDRHYEMRQLRMFQQMVANGLIYRQHRPVHYSPSSRSALAEAELEYKDDHVSHSVYVGFDLDVQSLKLSDSFAREHLNSAPKVQLLVWTTTPWTLTAHMGIAVHRTLPYYMVRLEEGGNSGTVVFVTHNQPETLEKLLGPHTILGTITGGELIGATYRHIFPGSTKSFEVIHAPHVTNETGTGLVHCAAAHGAEDYNAFRSLGLLNPSNTDDLVCHVDSKGQFTPDVADVVGQEYAKRLAGTEVLGDGNKEIVMILKELGKVYKVQRVKHRYPYDWKTNEPIIVTATSQWFANLDKIKDDALNALKPVSFFPEISRNRLEAFIQSRSEWCISRQRVWGVPIPALHHKETGRAILDAPTLDYILNAMESKNLDWWDASIEHFVPPWLLEEGKTAAETWEKGRDTMDVWFDSGSSWSMLAEMGVGRTSEEGRKFDADLCLEGSDQHRGWFQSQLLTAVGSRDASAGGEATSPYGTLITHGMVLDEKGKKMSKSLGNIISPMTIVRGSPNNKKEAAYGPDVLRLWAATVEYWRDMSIGPTVIAQAVESLRKLLINALNNFANITMSSLYFDITKDNLYANAIQSLERRAVVTVLEKSAEWKDPQASEDMANLLHVRGTVLALLEKARTAKLIKSALEAEVDIIVPDGASENTFVDMLRREENFLKTLFIVSDASIMDEGSLGTTSPEWLYSETISVPDDDIAIRVRPATLYKCPRCWTYARAEDDVLCERIVQLPKAITPREMLQEETSDEERASALPVFREPPCELPVFDGYDASVLPKVVVGTKIAMCEYRSPCLPFDFGIGLNGVLILVKISPDTASVRKITKLLMRPERAPFPGMYATVPSAHDRPQPGLFLHLAVDELLNELKTAVGLKHVKNSRNRDSWVLGDELHSECLGQANA
ncbi:hypothetical protein NLJ89_g199 [Agrocybe chaxingu]|uniref:isoleucine--tRNA ligase n=1 Tax=Agrocybe chaxingu TaxID=84603 RepID=A0A9W8N2G4_9AGAR|nr:hypothetical protein NLJ89_g199 [Agrocybe chaxingu]